MRLRLYRAEGRRRATRLLFLLHNYGGNEFQMATLAALLDPGGRFAITCPRGALETSDAADGASYYRIDRATHTYDEPSFADALAAVDEALDRACTEGGFDRSEAVVGGFSQGGGLALGLAYRASAAPRPAAVVALSPPVHPSHRVPWDLAAASGVAAFVGHGVEDATFPADASRAFVEELAARGADATWRGYPTRHQVVLDALVDARDWLASR
jgi:phospholipase/carboxylesterase